MILRHFVTIHQAMNFKQSRTGPFWTPCLVTTGVVAHQNVPGAAGRARCNRFESAAVPIKTDEFSFNFL